MKQSILASITCILLAGLVCGAIQCSPDIPQGPGQTELMKFSSYQELEDFLKTSTAQPQYVDDMAPGILRGLGFASESTLSTDSYAGVPDFSATNIQVEGVDEADIVKTDGEYIYVVSGNKIIIVKAYPPEEARVVSEIELDQPPKEMLINGDRLIVLQGEPYWMARAETDAQEPPAPQASIRVYDVFDRANPALKRDVSLDGRYDGCRMIGDFVYMVVDSPSLDSQDEVSLPTIHSGTQETEVAPAEVYYYNVSDSYYIFTTILAVDTQDDDEEPTEQTILLGATSTMYVSQTNIYLACTRWDYSGGGTETTAIHRVHMQDGKIEYQASGEVPGRLLNQFSMDEYQGYFRVATTTSSWQRGGETTSSNQVYVLDMALNTTGKLEDLAPGETIYSARFMGKRCYLVTFKKVDPFFVIDLSDPSNPAVLGELKITGYSDYLHPYDDNHVIGIGKETIAAVEGDFAWYQGVKISLFDVTVVSQPQEIAKYVIGQRGTESPVLQDHKALLFDASKNLLVIPVSVVESYWGRWQGAYVFDISLADGLSLRGKISHDDLESASAEEKYSYEDYQDYRSRSVQRTLYIGEVLYTISMSKIGMHGLENLDCIGEVELQ